MPEAAHNKANRPGVHFMQHPGRQVTESPIRTKAPSERKAHSEGEGAAEAPEAAKCREVV